MPSQHRSRRTPVSAEFGTLCESLLHQVVDYIGKDHLRQVVVVPDEPVGTAFVEIRLYDETPKLVYHAIDAMEEIRGMFTDELAIDYVFTDPAVDVPVATHGRHPAYAA